MDVIYNIEGSNIVWKYDEFYAGSICMFTEICDAHVFHSEGGVRT